MLKGINCWGLPQSLSLEEQLRFAARVGYDGVELSLTQKGALPYNAGSQRLEEIRLCAQACGIHIHSICCSLNWQASLTSDREEIREKAKAHIRRQVDVAEALGAGAVLALPGFVNVGFTSRELFADPNEQSYFPGSEIIDYETAWNRSVEAFRELAPYGEAHGVLICPENLWSKFLLSPMEMRHFLDEIGSPWVKAYLDVGNMMLYGYPEHWIRCLGRERIGRVHLKDFRRSVGTLGGFVELLSGDVDFPAVIRELRSIGYDGYVTAEINAYRDYPEQTAYNCMAAINAMLKETES